MQTFFGKDDNALHVVWATQDAANDYKTYYQRLPSSDIWGLKENVTDGSNVGGFPTVSKSQNRIHVSYNTGQGWDPETNLGDAKSRDKYINTWQTPQLVFTPESFRERIHAGSSKLLDFYYKLETGMGQYHADLYVKIRDFGSTSWSSAQLLQQFSGVREIVSAANTVDGKTHIVYEISDGVGYRNYNGSSWSAEEPIGSGYISPRIYSVSNDLFVAWGKDAPSQNKYVHYRQYDVAPLAPQNLTISKSANNHPLLSWLPNTEPDKNYYKLYRWDSYGGGWQPLAQTSNTSYEDGTLTYCTAIPPLQCPDLRSFQFKVTAVDLGSHESEPSNIVESRLVGGPPSKAGANDPNVQTVFEYSLGQNYPNPFNPTTTINYSIKAAGEVTLKVYDMLGTEVANLVNERLEAGNYSVEFNASDLPSGMYVYRLSTNNFVDTKKLILLK